MVKKLFLLFNKNISGLHEAAFILGISSIGSQFLALIRDRLFASTFGVNEVLDTYYASFRIPDLLYVLVASLVAGSVLIPFIVDKLTNKEEENLHIFLNSILTFFISLLAILSAIAFFVVPYFTDLFVPGFSLENKEIFINTTRILLLSPLLLGLSNLLGSVTQSMRRFFVYALTPIFYNVGIIIGILFFYKPFGISGLAYGVVLGAFLHFAIQIPTVIKSGIFPVFTMRPNLSYLKHVLIISLPRTITLSAYHIIIIVFTSLASLMTIGSISVFNFAYNLQSVPLAIIGVSYSVAAFPTLSKLFSSGNKEQFVNYIVTAGRHIIFWSMPVLSLFIVLRAQIVRVILGAGNFGWGETRLVAAALALFSFSVFAQGLILLFIRGYYASGNTKKPLIVNLISSFLSLFLAFILIKYFKTSEGFSHFFESLFRVEGLNGTEVLMLPLAFSIGALFNMTFIWTLFKKDFKKYYVSIRRSIFEVLASALIIAFVSYFFLRVLADVFDLDTFIGIFSQGFISGIVGLLVGIIFLKLLGNRELREIENSLRKKFVKDKPILPTPEDIL